MVYVYSSSNVHMCMHAGVCIHICVHKHGYENSLCMQVLYIHVCMYILHIHGVCPYAIYVCTSVYMDYESMSVACVYLLICVPSQLPACIHSACMWKGYHVGSGVPQKGGTWRL